MYFKRKTFCRSLLAKVRRLRSENKMKCECEWAVRTNQQENQSWPKFFDQVGLLSFEEYQTRAFSSMINVARRLRTNML